jgi:hypothetical protein
VRLFLVDGDTNGLVTAEIMNWTGHALIAPRQALVNALRRDEATRTGIYFLVGEDPDQPTKLKVYVGEGDVVGDRIKMHASDSTKDFWTKVCLITSKDPNITKAHVRYLESRLVELTKAADRANLANGNQPGAKALPESDVADMEFFLEQIQLVLPVVGFDFLRPKPRPAQVDPKVASLQEAAEPLRLTLENESGIKATAVMWGSEVTVLSGSKATRKTYAKNSYGPLRDQLISEGRLKEFDKAQLTFAEDITFASPSAAAAIILNRNSNGRIEWQVDGTGQTLKGWQDLQISK